MTAQPRTENPKAPAPLIARPGTYIPRVALLALTLSLAGCEADHSPDQRQKPSDSHEMQAAEIPVEGTPAPIRVAKETEAPQPAMAAPPAKSDVPSQHGESPGPSFACEGRLSAIERRVCEQPVLARLDWILSRAYGTQVKTANEPERAQLKKSQRAFLRARNACTDDRCIGVAYQARIVALTGDEAPVSIASLAGAPATAAVAHGFGDLSGTWEAKRGGLCLVSSRPDEYALGATAEGANFHSCGATGRAVRRGPVLQIVLGDPAVDDTCEFAATLGDAAIVFPDSLPEACESFCGARARYDGLKLVRSKHPMSWVSDAAGQPLCDERAKADD